MKNNQFRILLTLLLILIEIILGVFKDVIVETLPGKEFLEKYNIDIVTVLTVLFALVILLMIVEFFQEKEEHKIGLVYGIYGTEIENKVLPNQGIRQSIINTIILFTWTVLFLLFSILLILFINLLFVSSNYQTNLIGFLLGISSLLGIILYFGLLIPIIRCGTPAIKHLVLRVILWTNGYTPWNYAKFLDYCTNRLFLQRVSGSYRFMHDLLRQHFAKKYAE